MKITLQCIVVIVVVIEKLIGLGIENDALEGRVVEKWHG